MRNQQWLRRVMSYNLDVSPSRFFVHIPILSRFHFVRSSSHFIVALQTWYDTWSSEDPGPALSFHCYWCFILCGLLIFFLPYLSLLLKALHDAWRGASWSSYQFRFHFHSLFSIARVLFVAGVVFGAGDSFVVGHFFMVVVSFNCTKGGLYKGASVVMDDLRLLVLVS